MQRYRKAHVAGPLAKAAITDLNRFFEQKAHRPSYEQQRALQDLIHCFERIVTGKTARKVFLSSLDPGVGKTSCLLFFLRALLKQDYKTGVLICINQLSQIEDIAAELKVFADRIHLWTHKDLTDPKAIRSLGLDGPLEGISFAERNSAQVLITSHEQITRQMERFGSFDLAETLYFQDQPRTLRVWDEAWSPSESITVNAFKAMSVLHYINAANPDVAKELTTRLNQIVNSEDGDRFTFSHFAEKLGMERQEFVSLAPGDCEADRDVLSFLYTISGRSVSVKHDGVRGNTALTFRDIMPTNIAPLVVLDASGRVRVFYEDLVKRDVMRRLKSAPKDYGPLKLHVWNRGGGKRSFKDPTTRAQIVEGIAKTVAKKPGEPWLIVHHKAGKGVPDLRPMICEQVDRLCPGDCRPLLRFVSWGAHKASNAYVEISNVILAGILILPPSVYEAGKRAGANIQPHLRRITGDEVHRYRVSEHANDFLQALCRSAVRKSDGKYCYPADAYCIVDDAYGVIEALPWIFPGLGEVLPWQPIDLRLTDRQQRVFDIVAKWARTVCKGDTLKFADVQREAGIKSRTDFKELRDSAAFRYHCAAIGVFEVGNQRKNNWALSEPEKAPEAEFKDHFAEAAE